MRIDTVTRGGSSDGRMIRDSALDHSGDVFPNLSAILCLYRERANQEGGDQDKSHSISRGNDGTSMAVRRYDSSEAHRAAPCSSVVLWHTP